MKRSHALKTLRNVTISIVGLLVVVVGAGAAYTWYAGKSAPVTDIPAAPVETTHSAPVIKHVQRAANASIGASVQSLTSPVEPGANASLSVKTGPGATCSISVVYNNVPSKDSGLTPRVADDFGMVTWAWTVEESVPVGKWPIKVLCTLDEFSAAVQADLQVALP